MNQEELNKQTVDLMYAIQLETRNRSPRELYPEIWEPPVFFVFTMNRLFWNKCFIKGIEFGRCDDDTLMNVSIMPQQIFYQKCFPYSASP